MENKVGNGESGRRRFIRRLTTLGAAGGVAALMFGAVSEKPLISLAQAASGGALIIDAVNDGEAGTTELYSTIVGDPGATSGYAYGVFLGYDTATSGYAYGLMGVSDSTTGRGVRGWATAGSGETVGVHGRVDSPDGNAILGYSSATSGYGIGVYGRSDSPDGTGVWGEAYAPSGNSYGVWGNTKSPNGLGVGGGADANGAVGVYAQASSGWPGAIPMVAWGTSGQTASLQEWGRRDLGTLSAVDAAGQLGLGIAMPARQLHIRGNNAVARLDRDVDSASFIFTRTAAGDFNTVWKTFTFGVKATGVDAGKFFIGDMHTNVSGSSDNRILIDTNGNVGIGTTSPDWNTGCDEYNKWLPFSTDDNNTEEQHTHATGGNDRLRYDTAQAMR